MTTDVGGGTAELYALDLMFHRVEGKKTFGRNNMLSCVGKGAVPKGRM